MDFVETTLGVKVEYQKWEKENQLPYYIIDRYEIKLAKIDTWMVLIVYPKLELDQLNAVKKHIARIQQENPYPVVLVLPTITRQRREYLVKARIPFVVPNKQIYLPFLGVYFQEQYESRIPVIEKFQPSVQMLFLYYIYQNQSRLYTSPVAKALKISEMTITRATRRLEQTGFFEVEKDGVQKVLIGKDAGRELINKVRPYLDTPVKKNLYINKQDLPKGMFKAGLSALAELTMINPPHTECYATGLSPQEFNGTEILMDADHQIEIEFWKYDPQIFSKNNIVDPISLFLALADEQDERVEESIDKLIEKVWEK